MINEKEKIKELENEMKDVFHNLLKKYCLLETLYSFAQENIPELKGYKDCKVSCYIDNNKKNSSIYRRITEKDIKEVLPIAENDNYTMILIDMYEILRKKIDELIKLTPDSIKKYDKKNNRLNFIVYFFNDEILKNFNFTNMIITYIVLEEIRHNSVHNKREISANDKKKLIKSITTFLENYHYKKTKPAAEKILKTLKEEKVLLIDLIKGELDDVSLYLITSYEIFTKLCDNICCKLDELE